MNAPVEPTADLRTFANFTRQMYVALVDQGFTVPEALTIIGHVIAANMRGGSRG